MTIIDAIQNYSAMIIFTLLAIGVLVTIHEYGHFWVARRNGIKVLRFSIGFGKPLLSWTDKQGTEFVLAAIPLGGYVKMLDEREGDVSAEQLDQAFTRKTVWQRIAVAAAGPIANFILALAIFWGLYAFVGETLHAPVIGSVTENSPAARAGIEPGMEIVAVGDKETLSWRQVDLALISYLGHTQAIPLTVKYPDSSLRYEIGVDVNEWLADSPEPRPAYDLGLLPQVSAELSVVDVSAGSGAQKAGVAADDRLLTLEGEKLESFDDFASVISANPNRVLALGVERDGELLTLSLIPDRVVNEDGREVGLAGIQIGQQLKYPDNYTKQVVYGPVDALLRGGQETWGNIALVLVSVKKLIVGDISTKNLSGPITIAKVAGASAKSGAYYYLTFVAFLSVMLGVMNLMPIPVLDGGHILFYLIEAVKGSPVPEKIQMVGYQIGMILVGGLMLVAIFNDFTR